MLMPMPMMLALTLMLLFDVAPAYAVVDNANANAKMPYFVAILLVHCCDANATVAAVAQAADACDDAMLT
jgi:hypothetical protein